MFALTSLFRPREHGMIWVASNAHKLFRLHTKANLVLRCQPRTRVAALELPQFLYRTNRARSLCRFGCSAMNFDDSLLVVQLLVTTCCRPLHRISANGMNRFDV
jgi:hypothetical protein